MEIYGPYKRKDGRLHIVLYENGKCTSQSYPRFIMEQKLNRKLEEWEEVDHIDNDVTNNDISNFQILSKIDNIKKSAKETDLYYFICECGKDSNIPMSTYKNNQVNNHKSGPFCSKSCAGKFTYVKHYGHSADLIHGSDTAYGYHKCRCDICRNGNTIRKRNQRHKRKHID